MATSPSPMEDAVRQKVTQALKPTSLEIFNDSHLHSHHKAMKDTTSQETHFRLFITSEAFSSKMQPARHRMVYTLLKDELAAQGGIHALQLRTRTPEEDERAQAKDSE
ncbi:BolA domain UV induced protein Uvi31 [Friedmanniomyces endolithicus]|uniref:BolA domain UV induced protein Uvi31 n=1 Tax=Friedmanniomyces endolithicus TaxID=329885 RepID=A0AAN6HBU9_9PEZI|nr:BolA domain UV induced protein Uvi31 [Friedmanniomyces endolithicus]KAK0963325.1 BolA domain UV induced protein Uvi31 [Friedmanniomyces endolithicus]KAK1030939.1 BolA domain UV induced protein Uvi31 [Friedmanniomyces endolithicus]